MHTHPTYILFYLVIKLFGNNKLKFNSRLEKYISVKCWCDDDLNGNGSYFRWDLQDLNGDVRLVPAGRGQLQSATMILDPNPIRTALKMCNYLIAQQIYAVVVSHPSGENLSPATISYTGGFYHIPIIGISSREAAFSDKVFLSI